MQTILSFIVALGQSDKLLSFYNLLFNIVQSRLRWLKMILNAGKPKVMQFSHKHEFSYIIYLEQKWSELHSFQCFRSSFNAFVFPRKGEFVTLNWCTLHLLYFNIVMLLQLSRTLKLKTVDAHKAGEGLYCSLFLIWKCANLWNQQTCLLLEHIHQGCLCLTLVRCVDWALWFGVWFSVLFSPSVTPASGCQSSTAVLISVNSPSSIYIAHLLFGLLGSPWFCQV